VFQKEKEKSRSPARAVERKLFEKPDTEKEMKR
jgi:hypothetical protein